jgi:predicted enzyme related to lactoylglutathione lyase
MMPPRGDAAMITGAHLMLYTGAAEAVRAFFRDVLEYPHVDAGGGWLIFKLPPGEVAVHPAEGAESHELYLMCDDIDATVADLRRKGVESIGEVVQAGWGRRVSVGLPDGSEIAIYEPRHPTAHAR